VIIIVAAIMSLERAVSENLIQARERGGLLIIRFGHDFVQGILLRDSPPSNPKSAALLLYSFRIFSQDRLHSQACPESDVNVKFAAPR